ncbi:MAG: recombinase family protein [Magnetococcales bacterium]|nr:recombinase family protein [Magnetococcales bacterium]
MIKKQSIAPKIRCAIYTRKSTDDGLEMEFNTLDAQREACEAYIASQRSEGWTTIPDRYDDGGFSGGNLKRPGLKRLLTDVEAGIIDTIIVYKIDRLTRSLMDFSKLVDIFERHNTTFVSVTQQFSTTTSMGRLTLNMLLSFAQFEREISAERIRDKIAASRKRGLWMGGVPPLGYDVKDRKLIINKTEADLVRHIFKRYIQIGSTTTMTQELAKAGHKTKSWTTKTGRVREGKPIHKGALMRILNNRTYIGEAVHKEKSYPGAHDAIIDQVDWDRVQSIMATNAPKRASRTRAQTPSPLRGILRCGICGCAMTPTHTRKRGRIYRYYTCQNAAKRGHVNCPIKNVSAKEMEGIVQGQLQTLIQAPEMVARIWKLAKSHDKDISERDITEALQSLEPIWQELFPGEQNRLMELLVDRVVITLDEIELHLRGEGLDTLARDLNMKEAA